MPVAGQSGKRYDKLLVSSFEFRMGGPNYPSIAGKLVGGTVNDLRSWDFNIAGVQWPGEGSEEVVYFDLYRNLLLRGINVAMQKPILKVRTVERAPLTADNFGLAGHHFGRFEGDIGTDGSVYLDRKGKRPARPVDTKEKGRETYHPGGFGAQFAENLQVKLPPNLSWEAPEFKLLSLYIDLLKTHPSLKLEDVYSLHLFSGEEPIKALVTKDKEGYSGNDLFNGREFIWIGPEHPDFPDVVDDSSTIKGSSSDSEPEDMMKDSEYQSFVELGPHEVHRMKQHEERQQAAVGFDDADDETYFPVAGRLAASAAAKLTPESADKVTKNPRCPSKVKGNNRAVQTTASNLKVLTQFQQTVASSSGTSPVRTFRSLHNTPTTSPVTGPSNIQLSATNTPILQHGVLSIDRTKSPLKQTPSATQLRAESPAFKFETKNRLAADSPAVSSLLRMVQKQGVRAATMSKNSNAEVGEDIGAHAYQSPPSDVASPSPTYPQPAVEQGHAFGTDASRIPSSYYSTQSRLQSQPAGTAITPSMSSSQPHSQTQVNSGTTTPLYHSLKSLPNQAATASQTQNITTHITQRQLRVPVSRHTRQQHPTLQAPRPTAALRFPQPQPHRLANTNYYQTPPAGPASMSSAHNPATQHANTSATFLSFPPLAHPQPKVSANVAIAFSSYQSKMDGQSQGGAKESAGGAASGQQKPFQFTFGS
jgi:hypothetical protein